MSTPIIPQSLSGMEASRARNLEEQPALAVENVSVEYRSYKERPTSLKESVIRFIRKGEFQPYSVFRALSDVSFSIPHGSVFGIIGSNGSGKSTLLKVLSGVLKPTAGSVRSSGPISSMIELGAGFDRELTGEENIYLNGSLYRRSRSEIKARVPHILAFAELQEFAATPVKYYSSGMYARLGFAVAVDIPPDILVVDEILGVGDERFQAKCRQVFENLVKMGKTVVIVTHDLDQLREFADTALLLAKGRVVFLGNTAEAIEKYRSPEYQSMLA